MQWSQGLKLILKSISNTNWLISDDQKKYIFKNEFKILNVTGKYINPNYNLK